jgi:hypothetical protein
MMTTEEWSDKPTGAKAMTDETATVKLDPRRPLVKSALQHTLNNSDGEESAQAAADMVMATMVFCELAGLEPSDIAAMVQAGHANAVKAARSIEFQIESESYD